jgi:hypothetical protein
MAELLFELAASGDWSLTDLARWAVEHGFTMPPFRRRRTEEEILAEEEDDARIKIDPVSRLPTFNTIHKMLINPFYTGRIIGNDGVWVPSASHEPMVSDELFGRVQEALRNRNKSVHYVEVLEHPFRRLVRCGICERVYTPYPKKGIMYYGARCDRSCPNSLKTFNFEFIAEKIGNIIAMLSFTDEELAEIDARAETDIALLDVRRNEKIEASELRKKRIREDLAYLRANRLILLKAGVYSPEKLVAEEATLNFELDALKQEEDTSDISIRQTVRDVVSLSELLKNVAISYENASPHEKDKIVRLIFSELTLSENTLNYKCRAGLTTLARRFIPRDKPIECLSDLSGQRYMI